MKTATFERLKTMSVVGGTPKTHEKRSVPYQARLAPMIEQACAGKGPEGLLFGDGVNHMRN
ncbi:hypothetical protein [Microbacterium sp. ET2]|uniref:hypothetical protein n=1 Tax=Microbacterium albipurpureum TaxID=3050384 RepID=UPI002FDC9E96